MEKRIDEYHYVRIKSKGYNGTLLDYYETEEGELRCIVEYERYCRLDDPDAEPFDYPQFDVPADDLEDLGVKDWNSVWKKGPFNYGEHVRHTRTGYLGEIFTCYEDDNGALHYTLFFDDPDQAEKDPDVIRTGQAVFDALPVDLERVDDIAEE